MEKTTQFLLSGDFTPLPKAQTLELYPSTVQYRYYYVLFYCIYTELIDFTFIFCKLYLCAVYYYLWKSFLQLDPTISYTLWLTVVCMSVH